MKRISELNPQLDPVYWEKMKKDLREKYYMTMMSYFSPQSAKEIYRKCIDLLDALIEAAGRGDENRVISLQCQYRKAREEDFPKLYERAEFIVHLNYSWDLMMRIRPI